MPKKEKRLFVRRPSYTINHSFLFERMCAADVHWRRRSWGAFLEERKIIIILLLLLLLFKCCLISYLGKRPIIASRARSIVFSPNFTSIDPCDNANEHRRIIVALVSNKGEGNQAL